MPMRLLTDERYLITYRQQIKKLVRTFLVKSKLPNKYFKYHINMFENGIKNKNGLMTWIIEDLQGPVGYVVTILTTDHFNRPILVILQLNVENAKSYLNELVEYAKQAKVFRILFQSLRKRNVVKKWLGKEWNIGPTIFERVI